MRHSVQKQLLAEIDLTLAKAISVAQAAEIADTGEKSQQVLTTCCPQRIKRYTSLLLAL